MKEESEDSKSYSNTKQHNHSFLSFFIIVEESFIQNAIIDRIGKTVDMTVKKICSINRTNATDISNIPFCRHQRLRE